MACSLPRLLVLAFPGWLWIQSCEREGTGNNPLLLQGGIYHGRILLPPEYPFKPPSFIMLSPNGRFETGVKICLSISSHHPEQWQPSWGVRTAITALMALFPYPGNGAIGALVREFAFREQTCKMHRHAACDRTKKADAFRV